MAVFTGDLSPRASGSASLGVDMSNGMGGFTTDIRPYAHMHMNSGVWHDQSGQSGVLRYSRAAGGFEISIDGGATFSLVASASPIDLDDAYEIGNEIDQNQRTLSPTALSEGGMIIGQVPVIIKHTTPGAGNTNGAHSLTQGREDAGIMASGFTLTPNLPNTFAYTALGPGFIHLQASGTQSDAPTSFAMGLGNVGSVIDNFAIFATDAVMIFGARGMNYTSEGDGDITFTGQGLDSIGGQVALQAFGQSGQLEFRFGPHQGWYAKLTHAAAGGPFNDGFWPLPHSGQILEMISINGGGGGAKSKAITIERPAVDNDITIWYTNEAITITEIESVVRGTIDASGEFAIRHSTDRSQAGTSVTTLPITCTNRTTGKIDSSFASASIPADSWIWISVSGVSGVSTSQMNVTIQYI